MIKRDTFEIMKKISYFYDQFVFDQEKVNLWHEALKIYSFEEVQKNLFSHAAASSEPPKVYNLVPKRKNSSTIPNVEETRRMLDEYESIPLANPETAEINLAKMRVKLNITRGDEDGLLRTI